MKTKVELHLTFNSVHNPFFDVFFEYLTYLGDGVMALLTVIILMAVKYRFAIIAGFANFFASLLTQILKQTVYSDALRPKKFFEGIHDLYLIPGVDNHLYNSFPSGHSTCAFSLYLALALLVRNKALKLILFFLALMIGYSRIYLSQHFFEDVYAGSLIGVIITIWVYYLVQQKAPDWMDKSLITSFKNP